MPISKIFQGVIISSVLLASSSVLADDAKTFIGSACSFADNPLSSHNRIHHRFKNTSGANQWVTCPIVRDDVSNSLEYVGLDTVGTTYNVRLEQRRRGNGSLTGWNANGATNTGGSGRSHYWFNGSANGGVAKNASLALEVRLAPNAYINAYNTTEN